MPETVICVENLGKKYIIGHQQQEKYTALRDVIVNKTKSLGRRLLRPMGKPTPNPAFEEFWALADVSFEVNRGDRVGIIGRNGAGKSTLLKILSRITEPTRGRISIKGRVASLLEVGTGFHPELTGRENIFLNGAILGMSNIEIKKKFDEIVAFAEVEKFLDTPVKRYSSGMYVRLAFAVAAHLEPEILIVDEVLAVGDAQFQKKCLGQMDKVGKDGRTVLFVSHQMGMISQLCSRAFMLKKGNLVQAGEVDTVIAAYLDQPSSESNVFRRNKLSEDYSILVTTAKTVTTSGVITSDFSYKESICLQAYLNVKKHIRGSYLSISVKDKFRRKIFTSEIEIEKYINPKNDSEIITTMKIPQDLLTPGNYTFLIALHIPNIQMLDYLDEICSFTVYDTGSDFAMYEGVDYGCVFVNCEWQLGS
ncbi:MAG: ABC transporter ATP-binding protein [Crinalium sp.]